MLKKIKILKEEINKVFVGTEDIINNLLIGFFSGLHVLIEDIPGVDKTTLARTLAKSTGLDFGRIQFTPDLLPGDVLGMTIWSNEKKDFIFKPGAIMHQFVLGDEINRASAHTQSSMLEAMQEDTITIDGNTYQLPTPFFVIATQNPRNFSGTFQLPEAQVDRFGISFSLGYPEEKGELNILERFKETNPLQNTKQVISPEDIIAIRKVVHKIHASDSIKKYLIGIAGQTRKSSRIKLGMSPRASQHLLLASQAAAFLRDSEYIIPEDIIECAKIVLQHRLILSAEAKMENISIREEIDNLISGLPVPTGLKE